MSGQRVETKGNHAEPDCKRFASCKQRRQGQGAGSEPRKKQGTLWAAIVCGVRSCRVGAVHGGELDPQRHLPLRDAH